MNTKTEENRSTEEWAKQTQPFLLTENGYGLDEIVSALIALHRMSTDIELNSVSLEREGFNLLLLMVTNVVEELKHVELDKLRSNDNTTQGGAIL